METTSGDAALSTYEEFALIYNDFNAQNDYEMWLGRYLLPELERRGARKGRVLDVACGTGRAFEPLLSRGWEVQGSDISPGMLEVARRQFGDRVEVAQADMRELPVYGEFELALVMNDAVNYLTADGDLERALASIHANLVSGGFVLFDSNSLLMYRLAYEDVEDVREKDGRRWKWTGLGREDEAVPVYRSRIEGDGIEPIINEERYFTIPEVEAAMRGAGLEVVAALGQREEGNEIILSEPADEGRDVKIVFIGRRPD